MKLRLTKVLSVLLCAALIIGTQHSFINAISNSPTAGVTAGDINGDASVNNKDLTRLFQYLSDWDVSVEEDALDVNGDGAVNNKDLTRLFQYLSDWDVEIFVTSHCPHDGETEIRGDKNPTCSEAGYTGDTYCLICQRKIESGVTIPTIPHTGGTATCHTKAICEVCGTPYGEFDPNNHSGNTETRGDYAPSCTQEGYTGDTYCLGCGKFLFSGSATPKVAHTGGTATCSTQAICEICGTPYGSLDSNNHSGGTEIRNDYSATCTEYGYTGDTYCLGCGELLLSGSATPVAHTGGTATCSTQAICEICGTPYGSLDTNNHTGETEIRKNIEATCIEAGYTGDTYCVDCGQCIKNGTIIPATGRHVHKEYRGGYPATCTTTGYTGDVYCTECGDLLEAGTTIDIDPHAHSGGSATYYEKGICENCDEEYYADYAYYKLSEQQKDIYNAIDAIIVKLEANWVELPFSSGTTTKAMESDISAASHALAYDKPEYFWMPKVYALQQYTDSITGEHVKTEICFSFSAHDRKLGDFTFTPDKKAAMQAELDGKIEKILALAQNYQTDFEKEIFLHDYLCDTIVYDNDSAGSPNNADFSTYTVYGALVKGTCVCEGYSRAMQLLCRRLGISCGLVSGYGNGRNGYGPHMWNIIRIGGGLYYLDVTFDDLPENTKAYLAQNGFNINSLHKYFNITREQLEYDHKIDDMFAPENDYSDMEYDFNFFEIQEDATEYYYYTAVGAYIYENDATDAAQFAYEKWQEGKTTMDFCYLGTSENAKNLLGKKLTGKIRLRSSFTYSGILVVLFRK